MTATNAERRSPVNPRNPATSISGEDIRTLKTLLGGASSGAPEVAPSALTNTDLAFLLNVPTQQLSALSNAPSSLYVTDRRVTRNLPAEAGDRRSGQNLKCVRPYHAILVRLYLKHPEYTNLIPPRPRDSLVYELIQSFMRLPGFPLNTPDVDKSRYFAPYFGRSLVTSYKMLKSGASTRSRDNSRPVVQLQTLIVLRFAHEFRKLYAEYWAKYIPKQKRSKAIYKPQSRTWDILLERDSLTEWMNNRVFEDFESELYHRWQVWWDTKFMQTLEREAISRSTSIEEVLKTGQWSNKDEVRHENLPQSCAPITGASYDRLATFRNSHALSSAEMMWVLGIAPKTYFRYRKHESQRVDAPVSILIRHFDYNHEDLALFIPEARKGEELFARMKSVDPGFERKQLGVFFGCGAIAGYNMSRPNAEVPMFARRSASLMAQNLPYSEQIYWDLREAAESEARARGIDPEDLWSKGSWNELSEDDAGDHEAEKDEEML
ncbi:hypothetical protein [Marinobacter salarius]|uniref:Uncharacterized protein n=1 Tax=Marinobacter salarius TaxID=1420917 RepID=A0A1W6KFU9_9GAMM|nr:hypothetical protein [Marinobacter salarius]ARM86287.1 hypothetical protein MARSALSMR5_04270 [Marinobacter salarius]